MSLPPSFTRLHTIDFLWAHNKTENQKQTALLKSRARPETLVRQKNRAFAYLGKSAKAHKIWEMIEKTEQKCWQIARGRVWANNVSRQHKHRQVPTSLLYFPPGTHQALSEKNPEKSGESPSLPWLPTSPLHPLTPRTPATNSGTSWYGKSSHCKATETYLPYVLRLLN